MKFTTNVRYGDDSETSKKYAKYSMTGILSGNFTDINLVAKEKSFLLMESTEITNLLAYINNIYTENTNSTKVIKSVSTELKNNWYVTFTKKIDNDSKSDKKIDLNTIEYKSGYKLNEVFLKNKFYNFEIDARRLNLENILKGTSEYTIIFYKEESQAKENYDEYIERLKKEQEESKKQEEANKKIQDKINEDNHKVKINSENSKLAFTKTIDVFDFYKNKLENGDILPFDIIFKKTEIEKEIDVFKPTSNIITLKKNDKEKEYFFNSTTRRYENISNNKLVDYIEVKKIKQDKTNFNIIYELENGNGDPKKDTTVKHIGTLSIKGKEPKKEKHVPVLDKDAILAATFTVINEKNVIQIQESKGTVKDKDTDEVKEKYVNINDKNATKIEAGKKYRFKITYGVYIYSQLYISTDKEGEEEYKGGWDTTKISTNNLSNYIEWNVPTNYPSDKVYFQTPGYSYIKINKNIENGIDVIEKEDNRALNKDGLLSAVGAVANNETQDTAADSETSTTSEPISVLGYYPLYSNQDEAKKDKDGNGITTLSYRFSYKIYYMPGGLPSKKKFLGTYNLTELPYSDYLPTGKHDLNFKISTIHHNNINDNGDSSTPEELLKENIKSIDIKYDFNRDFVSNWTISPIKYSIDKSDRYSMEDLGKPPRPRYSFLKFVQNLKVDNVDYLCYKLYNKEDKLENSFASSLRKSEKTDVTNIYRVEFYTLNKITDDMNKNIKKLLPNNNSEKTKSEDAGKAQGDAGKAQGDAGKAQGDPGKAQGDGKKEEENKTKYVHFHTTSQTLKTNDYIKNTGIIVEKIEHNTKHFKKGEYTFDFTDGTNKAYENALPNLLLNAEVDESNSTLSFIINDNNKDVFNLNTSKNRYERKNADKNIIDYIKIASVSNKGIYNIEYYYLNNEKKNTAIATMDNWGGTYQVTKNNKNEIIIRDGDDPFEEIQNIPSLKFYAGNQYQFYYNNITTDEHPLLISTSNNLKDIYTKGWTLSTDKTTYKWNIPLNYPEKDEDGAEEDGAEEDGAEEGDISLPDGTYTFELADNGNSNRGTLYGTYKNVRVNENKIIITNANNSGITWEYLYNENNNSYEFREDGTDETDGKLVDYIEILSVTNNVYDIYYTNLVESSAVENSGTATKNESRNPIVIKSRFTNIMFKML